MKTKPTKPSESLEFKVQGSRFKVRLLFALLLTCAGGVLAQPFVSQPASQAVSLGSSATFQVSAFGMPPLTYQWLLDAGVLTGATNASLVISNVALADLGSYTVVVSNAAGHKVTQPAWLKLARWSEMVVFGDSASLAQYSNGNAWVDWLGQFLYFSAPGQIKNYAAGSAGTADVRSQINEYLSANTPGTNTLVATTWAGVSVDLALSHAPVAQVVSDYAINLSLLAQAGCRSFILPSVPPLYLNPALSSDAYVRSLDYADLNARMDTVIQNLMAAFPGLTVFRPDWGNQWVALIANPAPYGFTNVTGAANACTQCDPNRYVWWDGVHFTTAAHRWTAEQTYASLNPPPVMALPAAGTNGSLDLRWQGGSPPFRVQRSDDLGRGLWQPVASTFSTNVTGVSSSPHEFFRILLLGQ